MIPFLDIDYPLDETNKNATAEELRRMAKKQIEEWQQHLDAVNKLYSSIHTEYNRIVQLRSKTQRMVVSAEIYFEMVESLLEVTDGN